MKEKIKGDAKRIDNEMAKKIKRKEKSEKTKGDFLLAMLKGVKEGG